VVALSVVEASKSRNVEEVEVSRCPGLRAPGNVEERRRCPGVEVEEHRGTSRTFEARRSILRTSINSMT
jgi:hypothetical protein